MRAIGLRFKPLWNLTLSTPHTKKNKIRPIWLLYILIQSLKNANNKYKPTVPSTSTGLEELDELIGRHVEKSIQIDSSEAELLERPLLRQSRRRHIGLNVRLKHPHIHRVRKRVTQRERERDFWGGSPLLNQRNPSWRWCFFGLDLWPLGFFEGWEDFANGKNILYIYRVVWKFSPRF